MGDLLPFGCAAEEGDEIDRKPAYHEKPHKQDTLHHFRQALSFQDKYGNDDQDRRKVRGVQRNKQLIGQIRLREKTVINVENSQRDGQDKGQKPKQLHMGGYKHQKDIHTGGAFPFDRINQQRPPVSCQALLHSERPTPALAPGLHKCQGLLVIEDRLWGPMDPDTVQGAQCAEFEIFRHCHRIPALQPFQSAGQVQMHRIRMQLHLYRLHIGWE